MSTLAISPVKEILNQIDPDSNIPLYENKANPRSALNAMRYIRSVIPSAKSRYTEGGGEVYLTDEVSGVDLIIGRAIGVTDIIDWAYIAAQQNIQQGLMINMTIDKDSHDIVPSP